MKNYIVGALIIGVAVIVGFWVAKPVVQYGASSGPTHTNLEYFQAGLTQGGDITSIASATTTTLTAKQICDSSIIKFAANGSVGAASTTFPTATALASQCLQKNGDFKDFIFYNSSPAASTSMFVAGTGNTLFIPEVTGANNVLAGLNMIHVRVLRASSTGMYIFINEQLVQ